MEFRWIPWNLDKVAGHGVSPGEVEAVVRSARSPYPQFRDDGKLLVWGPTSAGRLLQVVYLLDLDDLVFVIHARPLTDIERWRWQRARRRRGRS